MAEADYTTVTTPSTNVRRRSTLTNLEDVLDVFSITARTPDNSESSQRRRLSSGRKKTGGLFSSKAYEHVPSSSTIPEGETEQRTSSDEESFEASPHHDDSKLMASRSYWHVIVKYPSYRYYFLSHLCQNVGDWFVRVASLLVIDELAPHSGSALANLALASMLPKTVFAPLGGLLADKYDRRKLMIILDIIAGFAVLLFLVALAQRSLETLYLVSALRSAISSIYYPVTSGIVPLLIHDNPDDLKLAVTINSWAWCSMAILGGLLAGTATECIGLQACYILDAVTYFISAAVVVWGIKGNYRVSNTKPRDVGEVAVNHGIAGSLSNISAGLRGFYRHTKELMAYLLVCGFGFNVLLKASAAFVWGPEDVIGVQYATVDDDEDATSFRLGLLFSVVGLGCAIGPPFMNLFTNANNPASIQRACCWGFFFLGAGWLGISTTSKYNMFLLITTFRVMGSSILWVNSTLLLQMLSEKHILGRILSMEYTVYTLAEAASATLTGKLDDAGFSQQDLALFGAAMAVVLGIVWSTYQLIGGGAANPKFAPDSLILRTQTKSTDDVTLATAEIELDTFDDEIV